LKGITVSLHHESPQELARTTTTAALTATGLILAMDLGKDKSVACACNPATAQARFDSISTCRQQLLQLIQPWVTPAPSWSICSFDFLLGRIAVKFYVAAWPWPGSTS